MERGKNSFPYLAAGFVLLLALLGVWEIAGRVGKISTLALPLPSHVFLAGIYQLGSAEFLANWYRTLSLWLISLLVGLLVGLCLGFFAGTTKSFALIVLPVLGFLRSVPPIALFPIALIALGPGRLATGVVASLGAALYVFPGTAEAARLTDGRFAQLSKILGSSKLQFLKSFVVPGTALHALASSRIAATYAFAVCVAGEMIIGGRYGVGAAILDLSERYRLEEAYAYILYTGLVGLIIDGLFSRVSRLGSLGNLDNRP